MPTACAKRQPEFKSEVSVVARAPESEPVQTLFPPTDDEILSMILRELANSPAAFEDPVSIVIE